MPDQDFNLTYAENYLHWALGSGDKQLEMLHQSVASFIRGSSFVLELMSGTGLCAQACAQERITVYDGVDINQSAVDLALKTIAEVKNQHPPLVRFWTGDARNSIPGYIRDRSEGHIRYETYDAVICNASHLLDDFSFGAVLRNLRAAAKPGAKFWVAQDCPTRLSRATETELPPPDTTLAVNTSFDGESGSERARETSYLRSEDRLRKMVCAIFPDAEMSTLSLPDGTADGYIVFSGETPSEN